LQLLKPCQKRPNAWTNMGSFSSHRALIYIFP
jgi:hypothetical protein